MLHILVDGDMIIFKAAVNAEVPINWWGDFWTLHADAAEAKAEVDDMIVSLVDKVLNHYNYEGKYKLVLCFTDPKDNFRKHILPTYKANRKDTRKPMIFPELKDWCFENYDCIQKPKLEADDCIGILATKYKDSIIISGDKDFKTIPCRFYDFSRDEFFDTTEEQANYWFYYQTLVGDRADNYAGCPGVGDVTARKLLEKDCSWDTVVSAFEKVGLSEEDALVQARVARILRNTDYKGTQVILWNALKGEPNGTV